MIPSEASGAAPGPGSSDAPDPVAQTLALLQPWIDFVPPRQRRLGLFIVVALLAHLAVFFVVQIDATRPEFQHQGRIHVAMESPGASSAGIASDAMLDRLADPRLFLLPVFPAAASLPAELPPDVTSNLGPAEWPAPAPAPAYSLVRAQAPTPSEQAAAAMLPPRQPFSYAGAPAPPAPATGWQWDAVLAGRQPAGMAALASPVSDTDLSPTELRVAVDSSGAVRNVLLESTCQKPEFDQQAILAARKVRFHASGRPGLDWGRLTVFWRTTAPPTPPPPTPTPANPTP
jgi:TonB family protein